MKTLLVCRSEPKIHAAGLYRPQTMNRSLPWPSPYDKAKRQDFILKIPLVFPETAVDITMSQSLSVSEKELEQVLQMADTVIERTSKILAK